MCTIILPYCGAVILVVLVVIIVIGGADCEYSNIKNYDTMKLSSRRKMGVKRELKAEGVDRISIYGRRRRAAALGGCCSC